MIDKSPSIVVVGSVNLDIAATVSRLPVAGETITNATIERFPGGKGANQALAAKRLGANVSLISCVGDDANSIEALALLEEAQIDLSGCRTDKQAPTGVALISVGPSGENQIVVAPGANRALSPDMISIPPADAMIGQLEIPVETLSHAVASFDNFVCLNLAPAMEVPDALIHRADLIIVNETEAGFFGDRLDVAGGLIAKTYGKDGAALIKDGEILAKSKPPVVDAVDATGAGDTFTAALTLAMIEGQAPQEAVSFACAAGAIATTTKGAQPSLPMRADVEEMLGSDQHKPLIPNEFVKKTE